jgi:chemotaxis protein CheZ
MAWTMTSAISNEEILKALVDIGGGLHREFSELRQSLQVAAKSINEQKIEEAALLARELQELSHHIDNTKREIAMLAGGAAPGPGPGILAANFELDAIVKATEDATNNIMTAAETIEAIADKLGSDAELTVEERNAQLAEIRSHVARVFEHCSFQDITGQRISKVIKTLDYIETRIENMIQIWGKQNIVQHVEEPAPIDPSDESHLLNGPQLPDQGVTQNEIDQLFQ